MAVCKKLWYNVEVDLEGKFQPCSSFRGNVECKTYDLESYYSSPTLSRCISDHQNNIKNKECQICWEQEAHGHRSLRQSIEADLPDISERPELLTLDYSLDHLCNLKCLMCSETASSAIMSEKIQLGIPVFPVIIKKEPTRLEFLEKNIQSLIELKIYNTGEPMMSPLFEPLINLILSRNPNIKLMVSTNGTKVSDRIISKISQIKNLTLKVSLDGYQRVNDFIRYPSKWEDISIGVDKLKTLPNADLVIHSTVQALNLYQMDRLLQWSTDLEIPLELAPVNRNPMLDLRVIPVNSRDDYQQKVVSMIKSKKLDSKNMRIMLATLKQLEEQQFCAQSHSELVQHISSVCTLRGIRPRDFIPVEVDLLQINT